MTLRVDMRTTDVTVSVSGRSARELLAALGTLGHWFDEQTLESWLLDLERQQLATRDDDGRWRLSAQAFRAFGHGLSLIGEPRDGGPGVNENAQGAARQPAPSSRTSLARVQTKKGRRP